MDVFDWIRKNKGFSFLISLVLFLGIPLLIDKLYNIPAPLALFAMSYSSSDILSFYGIVLGSATTILALIETIQHAEKTHALDYERKLTPLLDSNIYNHTNSSITPLRILYVNVSPSVIYNKVTTSDCVDPRDFEDIFYGCQIDYLIQNISETSAVNIKVYLNGDLLHGPFSLIAGSEASIGLYVFDERGRTVGTFSGQNQFNFKVTYTNSDKSKIFTQTESIVVEHIFMSLRDDPPFMPNIDTRSGLSEATTT